MNKISVSKINLLLEKKINSKGISLYLFLISIAEQNKTLDGFIYNANPHKICRIMKDNNIPISHRQVLNSLKELEAAGFISYSLSGNTLILDNACIDFQTEIFEEANTSQFEVLHKSKGFVYLSQVMLTNLFYRLSIAAKRLFLYVYKHFTKSKHFITNILKKESLEKLYALLSVNRPQKIRNAMEEVKALLKIKTLQSTMKIETYQFELNTLTKASLLKTEEEIHSSFIKINSNSRIKEKILFSLMENDTEPTQDEIREILKATVYWNWRDIYPILQSYTKTKLTKGIKNIYGYFKAAQLKFTF